MKALESITAILLYAALVTFVFNGASTLASNFEAASKTPHAATNTYKTCYTCNAKKGN